MADLSFVNTREFSRLISKPSTLTVFDMVMLEDLVELYPFSFPLHVSFAYALKKFKPERYDEYLAKAAIYIPDRTLLHKIINHVERFENPANQQPAASSPEPEIGMISADAFAIPAEDDRPTLPISTEEEKQPETTAQEQNAEPESLIEPERKEIASEASDSNNVDFTSSEPPVESVPQSSFAEFADTPTEPSEHPESTLELLTGRLSDEVQHPEEEAFDEEPVYELPELPADDTQEDIDSREPEQTTNEIEPYTVQSSQDEVPVEFNQPLFTFEYPVNEDNLAEDLEVAPEPSSPSFVAEDFNNTIETVVPDFEQEYTNVFDFSDTESSLSDSDATNDTPPEKEIIGSIASTDYFVFDRSAIDPLQTEEEVGFSEVSEPERKAVEPGKEALARYDDDKMPFSFLWWLNKTRKEHADTYQPYAPSKNIHIPEQPAEVSRPEPLQQQIVENIFHIQPEINVFETEPQRPVDFGAKRKEDVIIEKFINEDPQIRPPKLDKLDTENKARKSSEDHLDLVSETLARIYTDQMLYHKAIDTYQKLSLKFPEKSSYFDARISEIEKKIN